jgi:hypothetical protein
VVVPSFGVVYDLDESVSSSSIRARPGCPRRPQGRHGGVRLLVARRPSPVARRSELAEESAVKAAALASPTPEVMVHMGSPGPRRAPEGVGRGSRGGPLLPARWSTGPCQPGYGHGGRWAIGPPPAGNFPPWQE